MYKGNNRIFLLKIYFTLFLFFNVDKDGTSQLGIKNLALLEKATQELLNMKRELEENDKQYELKYNSSGYIYFRYNLSCSKKFMRKSLRCVCGIRQN